MKIQIAFLLALTSIALAADRTHWVVTWGASPAPQLSNQEMRTAKLEFENQTLREIVYTNNAIRADCRVVRRLRSPVSSSLTAQRWLDASRLASAIRDAMAGLSPAAT